MSSAAVTHISTASSANGPPVASRSTTTSGQGNTPAASFDVSEDLPGDPVDDPDDEDRPDVRPETVDREVRRDPLRKREHRDVQYEVEEPEGDDDQGQRQEREHGLDDRVGDAKHS